MILRLLKNELRHGVLTNLVMMIFIAISAMLSCTSIQLIYSSARQISYFMDDMGNVTDLNYTMIRTTPKDQEDITKFFKERKIQDVQLDKYISLPASVMKFEGLEEVISAGSYALTKPEKYNLLFDEDSEIPVIQKGFVGIPLSMKTQMALTVGQRLTISHGSQQFEYEIQCFIRDPLYGADMVGQKRLLFHMDDFEQQYEATSDQEHALHLSIKDKDSMPNVEAEMQKAGFPDTILITKDTAYLAFLGMIIGTCAILLMSGVILLCMSFLIIRFTILFQIENNYTEIGVMKAIGLRHSQIKPLYMVKYLGIAFIGAVVGFTCSIPIAYIVKEMQSGVVPVLNDTIGIMLSLFMALIILLMVYSVTSMILHRLKKQSTMDAIRKGNEGETFHAVSQIELKNSRRLPVYMFLAGNDLLVHIKNTVMMVLIYALCILLLLIPLSLKNSFVGGAFLQILKISSGDLYTPQYEGTTQTFMKEQREALLQDLKTYDDNVSVEIETLSSAAIVQGDMNTNILLIKRADSEIGFDRGVLPILKNEIAISSTVAKSFDKTVGDSINVSFEGTNDTYIITGVYTSMMNLGNTSIMGKERVNNAVNMGYLVVNFSGNDAQQKVMSDRVLSEYKDITLVSAEEKMINLSGDVASQIALLSDMMAIVILFIVFALTILFSKMQLLRAKKAIALLQSLGYHRHYLRRWQFMRCVLLILMALLIGLGVNFLFTNRIIELFFKGMGMGVVNIVSDPFYTYMIYPAIFFIVVITAQWMIGYTIRKQNIKDISEE